MITDDRYDNFMKVGRGGADLYSDVVGRRIIIIIYPEYSYDGFSSFAGVILHCYIQIQRRSIKCLYLEFSIIFNKFYINSFLLHDFST